MLMNDSGIARVPVAARRGRIGAGGSGFTLIELLVVIAIIAVLVSLLFVGLSAAYAYVYKSRDLHLVKSIQTGVDAFYADTGKYPPGWGTADVNSGAGDATPNPIIPLPIPNAVQANGKPQNGGPFGHGNGFDGSQCLGACLVGPVVGRNSGGSNGHASGLLANGRHFGPYLQYDQSYIAASYSISQESWQMMSSGPGWSGESPYPIDISTAPAFKDSNGYVIFYYAANPQVNPIITASGSGMLWGSGSSYRFNTNQNSGQVMKSNIPPMVPGVTNYVGDFQNTPRPAGWGASLMISQVFATPVNVDYYWVRQGSIGGVTYKANVPNQQALANAMYLLLSPGQNGQFVQTVESYGSTGHDVIDQDDIIVWGP